MHGSWTQRALLWDGAIQCPENSPLGHGDPGGLICLCMTFAIRPDLIPPAIAWGLQWILTAFVTADYQTDLS